MLNQTKPGLWENTNVLAQLREDLSRAKRLDFGNFVTEIQREIDWLEFFDAETTLEYPNRHMERILDNLSKSVANNFNLTIFYAGQGNIKNANLHKRIAHDLEALLFWECN